MVCDYMTAYSRMLLYRLMVVQIFKKSLNFCKTQNCITPYMRVSVHGRLNSALTINRIPSNSQPLQFPSTDLSFKLDVPSVLQVLHSPSFPLFRLETRPTSSQLTSSGYNITKSRLLLVLPLVSAPELWNCLPVSSEYWSLTIGIHFDQCRFEIILNLWKDFYLYSQQITK